MKIKKLLTMLLIPFISACNLDNTSSSVEPSNSNVSSDVYIPSGDVSSSSEDFNVSESSIENSSSIIESSSSSSSSSSTVEVTMSYTLKGRVIDTNNNPIKNVDIKLYKEEFIKISRSDAEGNYIFYNIKKGTYNVSLALPDGYEISSYQNTIEVSGDNEDIVFTDIVLKKTNISWGELS